LCRKEFRQLGHLVPTSKFTNKIPALKPLLDQLVREGFRRDPAGAIYRGALARAGEWP
jgi:hypothetical protein